VIELIFYQQRFIRFVQACSESS